MKIGDLVRYAPKMAAATDRVGIVVEIHYRVVPTAVVQWNGIEGTMGHRIDLLEVLSESR
jgi:hypothetical protein